MLNDPIGYRFGFQGQEGDNEINGEGNSYAFKYRIHDPRLGRFLSVDPLAKDYAWNSTYAFAENSPIAFMDLEGLERFYAPDKQFIGQYGTNTELYVVDQVQNTEELFSTLNNITSFHENGNISDIELEEFQKGYDKAFADVTASSEKTSKIMYKSWKNDFTYNDKLFGYDYTGFITEASADGRIDKGYGADNVDFSASFSGVLNRIEDKKVRGGKNYNITTKGVIDIGEVEAKANYTTSWNNSKKGFSVGADLGVYGAKADFTGDLNIGPMKFSLSGGGSALTLNAGANVMAIFDESTGVFTSDLAAHAGAWFGLKGEIKFEYDTKKSWKLE